MFLGSPFAKTSTDPHKMVDVADVSDDMADADKKIDLQTTPELVVREAEAEGLSLESLPDTEFGTRKRELWAY
jgi:hypothetical protein